MFEASCSADEEPANTRPIVAPLLLIERGPRKGASSFLSMNLHFRPVNPLTFSVPKHIVHL